ncbi:hypothetical protein [Micromonospora schwarzwaldensis]|uniref:hypothetical protein n=1 Tax=Micromonospora sp. DSM 45708 TaxID=3111767 RepID=UPI0031D0ABC8
MLRAPPSRLRSSTLRTTLPLAAPRSGRRSGPDVDIGFQATHSGNTGRPAAVTLNGVSCSVG